MHTTHRPRPAHEHDPMPHVPLRRSPVPWFAMAIVAGVTALLMH
jgi:hypothetical protein